MKKISLIKKFQFNLFKSYRNIQKELHELTYFFWECTLRCNLTCIHCGSDCYKTSEIKDMPLEDFLKVLDEIKEVYPPNKTIIVLTGGEPLLRPDIEECGRQFLERGFPWGMVSNGYALTEKKFAALVNNGMRSLTISLDGTRESHNWLRNKEDSFDKAINAIQAVKNHPSLVFDVVTCVNQNNINELDEIKKLLIENGIKKWRLFTIFPKGRAKDEPLLDLKEGQLQQIMEFIVKTKKEGHIDPDFSCEGFLGGWENEARKGFFFCRAGINIGSVLANGDISACPSLRGDYIQGNIYKDKFMDIWENKFSVMRNREWTKNGKCSECKMYSYCEGNGLHLRDEKSGELLRCHYEML